MGYYITKVAITTLLIVLISEIAKRSSFVSAVLASVPLVSVLAMVWLYVDTRDVERVSALSSSIFWLVIPSLALFISLPLLLKQGIDFYPAMGISIAITVLCYWLMLGLLRHLGVALQRRNDRQGESFAAITGPEASSASAGRSAGCHWRLLMRIVVTGTKVPSPRGTGWRVRV